MKSFKTKNKKQTTTKIILDKISDTEFIIKDTNFLEMVIENIVISLVDYSKKGLTLPNKLNRLENIEVKTSKLFEHINHNITKFINIKLEKVTLNNFISNMESKTIIRRHISDEYKDIYNKKYDLHDEYETVKMYNISIIESEIGNIDLSNTTLEKIFIEKTLIKAIKIHNASIKSFEIKECVIKDFNFKDNTYSDYNALTISKSIIVTDLPYKQTNISQANYDYRGRFIINSNDNIKISEDCIILTSEQYQKLLKSK